MMQPNILDAASWNMIASVIGKLTVFVVLMVLGAFSMLLSRAVLPSLIATHQLVESYAVQRRVLIAAGLVSFALAIVQLARVVDQVIAILDPFFPRWVF
jgi:hypothetical protein